MGRLSALASSPPTAVGPQLDTGEILQASHQAQKVCLPLIPLTSAQLAPARRSLEYFRHIYEKRVAVKQYDHVAEGSSEFQG